VRGRLRPEGGAAVTSGSRLRPSLVSRSPAAMPRVVANQRERFDNDELFRKLSRDMEASVRNSTVWAGRAYSGPDFISSTSFL